MTYTILLDKPVIHIYNSGLINVFVTQIRPTTHPRAVICLFVRCLESCRTTERAFPQQPAPAISEPTDIELSHYITRVSPCSKSSRTSSRATSLPLLPLRTEQINNRHSPTTRTTILPSISSSSNTILHRLRSTRALKDHHQDIARPSLHLRHLQDRRPTRNPAEPVMPLLQGLPHLNSRSNRLLVGILHLITTGP
jgi:hypothetical protein